ncbi:unnamed protein product [Ixodes pacificus]
MLYSLSVPSVDDTLNSILDESGDEEEQDAIVNQVLDEIGIEVSGKVSSLFLFFFCQGLYNIELFSLCRWRMLHLPCRIRSATARRPSSRQTMKSSVSWLNSKPRSCSVSSGFPFNLELLKNVSALFFFIFYFCIMIFETKALVTKSFLF